ncbi:MAG: hypothetical protein M3Q89_07410 [Verrucomicrobiota bacterium]|nr:hypothetical protein [Verrucomicrobiota bacterium]
MPRGRGSYLSVLLSIIIGLAVMKRAEIREIVGTKLMREITLNLFRV